MFDTVYMQSDSYNAPMIVNAFLGSLVSKMTTPHEALGGVESPTKASELVDAGLLISSTRCGSNDTSLYQFDDETYVRVTSDENKNLTIAVYDDYNDEGERSSKILAKPLGNVDPMPVKERGRERIRFWYWTNGGAYSQVRNIDVTPWSSIEHNYAGCTRKSLNELMEINSSAVDRGKILLMHGPPGTGKTTAIRALADAWRDWCTTEYVIDPERAFGEASYLTSLLIGNVGSSGGWRMVVIEDAEEFLVPRAKHEVGQSVARLLNLGDGLIGQGLKVLILMTTNEPIEKLHPALTRPGRCLANIEVPPMSAEEATKWLGESHGEATLAELFEAKSKSQVGDGIRPFAGAGQYL